MADGKFFYSKSLPMRNSCSCPSPFQQISYGNVMPVLQLADKYNVKDLLKLGLDFMARNVSLAIRKHQIVSWYQFANNANYR